MQKILPAPHRSELEFRRLLDKLPTAAYTCDANGLITFYNHHALELWGRAPKLNDPEDRFCGAVRLYATDGTPIPPENCWMARALRENQAYDSRELILERPDGSRVTVLANASPFYDEDGQVAGAVNVFVDITERRQTEERMKEADHRKDEFLATLAHELRNPLAPLRNALQILRLAGNQAVAEEAHALMERQLQHLVRLIDELLDVSRITRGKLRLRTERVELATVLTNAVETSRPFIEAAEHELTVTLPQQPLVLEADPLRLAQIFTNLLNNAAKYSPRGSHIWITAECEGDEAVIAVRDEGIGIPPQALPQIFEMFSQVDHSLERSHGGLGIGLTLVKRLTEMHGGSVTAESEGLGKGSTFTVRLPATALAAVADSPDLAYRVSFPTSRHILVVDDNTDGADSLGMMLRLMGNEVQVANDGYEAVKAADRFRPELILMDIGMPKLNGYDAARRIRQQSWSQDMILVALTGWGQPEDKRRAFDAGFDYHFTKPMNLADLEKLLAQVHPVRQAEACVT